MENNVIIPGEKNDTERSMMSRRRKQKKTGLTSIPRKLRIISTKR